MSQGDQPGRTAHLAAAGFRGDPRRAKALLGLLTCVDGGEEITITRHGKPIAVVVRPDALRRRRASGALDNAVHLHELLEVARTNSLSPSVNMRAERAEELIAAIRESRDEGWRTDSTPMP